LGDCRFPWNKEIGTHRLFATRAVRFGFRSGKLLCAAGGVYRLNGQEMKPKWEDMRKQPGFPNTDNCTAVCEDSLGRIWVGTSNMGVQVFHKGQWKRYDRDTVIGGSHVHALASSSTGLTAVAHEQGVRIYYNASR
jgi:ligand-binding sensor domain-containing protein